MNEREIFEAAADIDDASARNQFVAQQCGGNDALRQRITGLLQSHEAAGSFLESPAAKQLAPPVATAPDSAASEEGSPAGTTLGADAEAPWLDTLPTGLLEPSSKPDSLGRIAHHEVLQVLGRGAFGIVLKAFDERLHRVVAIKIMAPELATTSPARKRFLREARASAAVRHENVVNIHSVDEQPLPYLVMEYIPGQTLQDKLDSQGPLDVAEVLRLGQQIASGLAAAHAMGLVHRDIKPANILLEAGLEERVKITDFGLARAADDASITQSGLIAGTPMYMAPEQAAGGAIDQRADLFSLGSVLYVMITGRPPFRASTTYAVLKRVTDDTPRPILEIIPETPAELCNIVARLHSKQPSERFQSAEEAAQALRHCRFDQHRDDSLPGQTFGSSASLRPEKPTPAYASTTATWPAPTKRSWAFGSIAAVVILASLGMFAVLGLTAFMLLAGLYSYRSVSLPTPVKVATIEKATQETEPPQLPLRPIFTGVDLSGWETLPNFENRWRVEDGAIVCDEGPAGYLFLKQDLPRNFRLRCEVKISKDGDGGLIFGAPFEAAGKEGLPGFEVQIQSGEPVAPNWRTGALAQVDRTYGWQMLTPSDFEAPADKWLPLEVWVSGGYMQTTVAGKRISDYFPPTRNDGRLVLQRSSGARIAFRNFELIENPAHTAEH